MSKNKCNKCEKNFNRLTKEGFCAYCYQDKFGSWSLEFSDYTKDKDGKLISNIGNMSFNSGKTKRPDNGKKLNKKHHTPNI